MICSNELCVEIVYFFHGSNFILINFISIHWCHFHVLHNAWELQDMKSLIIHWALSHSFLATDANNAGSYERALIRPVPDCLLPPPRRLRVHMKPLHYDFYTPSSRSNFSFLILTKDSITLRNWIFKLEHLSLFQCFCSRISVFISETIIYIGHT